MRILIINHEFPPVGGGAASASLQLAMELGELGVDVTVITSAYAECPKEETREGVLIRRIAALRRHTDRSNPLEMLTFLLSSLWWVIKSGRKEKFDATIAFFGIPGAPAAWLLNKIGGVPYIVSLRGGDVPGFLPQELKAWHALTGWLIRFLWRQSAAVVANSTGLRAVALRSAPTQSVDIIPNGVDVDFFSPASAPNDVGKDALNLTCVGRLSSQKGLDTLLEALAVLPTLQWRLHLIGDGPERDALGQRAHALGIFDHIVFEGWLERASMPERLRQADIFVFPSVQEGMPNAVLEAMACGLPVIACRIEGCEELVLDGETGLLVPPGDVAALSAALEALINDANTRMSMGIASRERVLRDYTWKKQAQQYLQLCKGIS